MPISKNFSKSPFEIIHPKDRWKPDIDLLVENVQRLYAPFVEKIRQEIYEWRQFGYEGISETSKCLLNYWFNTTHSSGFQYYFGQRESVESVIYLFEKMTMRSSASLLFSRKTLINSEVSY